MKKLIALLLAVVMVLALTACGSAVNDAVNSAVNEAVDQANEAIADAAEQVGELIYEGPNVTLGYAEQREDLARGDERQGRLVAHAVVPPSSMKWSVTSIAVKDFALKTR